MQTVNATLDNYADTFRRTDKFIGMKASRRRQALTVTAAWEVIHGPKFPIHERKDKRRRASYGQVGRRPRA